MAPWLIGATWASVMSLIWSMYCSIPGTSFSRTALEVGFAHRAPMVLLSTDGGPAALGVVVVVLAAGACAEAGTAARVARAARPATNWIFIGWVPSPTGVARGA